MLAFDAQTNIRKEPNKKKKKRFDSTRFELNENCQKKQDPWDIKHLLTEPVLVMSVRSCDYHIEDAQDGKFLSPRMHCAARERVHCVCQNLTLGVLAPPPVAFPPPPPPPPRPPLGGFLLELPVRRSVGVAA